jgi:hypothetical protein
MATHGLIEIKSNDGSQTLMKPIMVNAWEPVISVTSTGVTQGSQFTYSYSGDKTFLGVATVANATEPTYAVGNDYTLSIDSLEILTLYIVEGEANTPTKKFTRLYLGEIVKTIGNKVLRKLQTTEYIPLPSLTAPTVEISETTLNIYDEEGLATSYDILVDGEVKATVEKVNTVVGDITITVSSFSTLTFTHTTSSGETVEAKTASSGSVTFSNIASGSYIAITGIINQFVFNDNVNCVADTMSRLITDIGESASVSVSNLD